MILNNKKILKNNYILILLILISTILTFINSPYSPIRDLAYLDYDSTIFYIIGKGMKQGFVPYIDLIDHKGIYIFFINYLGALISEYNHIGMFIVHLLIEYFTIIIIYKISSLFTDNKYVSFLSALIIFVLYNSYYFCFGGIKCETFLSPFIYLSSYLFLKYLLNDGDDNSSTSPYKHIFINGLCAGITLFTKFNLVIYYLPIVIVLIIKSKFNIKLILKYFLYGSLGVITASIPPILYSVINHCFNEMIYYTFTFNFLYAGALSYQYSDIYEAIYEVLYLYKEIIILSLISVIIVYKLKRKIFIYYALFVLAGIFSTVIALKPYTYYCKPLVINMLPIFMLILSMIFKKCNKWQTVVAIIIFAIIACVSYRICWFETKENNRRQYLVSEEMLRLISDVDTYGSDNSTLVIGTAIYIYNDLNVIPKLKFFCTPHIRRDTFSEPYEEIIESVKKKENAWLVLSFNPFMIKSGFSAEIREMMEGNYIFIWGGPYFGAEIYHRKD